MSDTEETVDDRKMVITMGVVVAALLILAVCIGGAARLMGGGETHENDLLMRNALLERIQPVGGVRTSADDMPAAAPLAVADASAAPRSRKQRPSLNLQHQQKTRLQLSPRTQPKHLGQRGSWVKRLPTCRRTCRPQSMESVRAVTSQVLPVRTRLVTLPPGRR